MRKQFVSTLIKLAEKDKDIMLITCDVGFGNLEPFRDRFPDQFINAGLAEQNAIGVATGLALAGKKPWVYSMINFVLFRPYEQVRTMCYHNANVKLIGVSGGGNYGFLGFSHNIVEDEDYFVTQKLPNLGFYTPKKPAFVKSCVESAYETKGPAYIRL